MSGEEHTPTHAGPDEPAPVAEAWTPPTAATEPVAPAPGWEPTTSAAPTQATDRPEVFVGAAFAGGLMTALILKRLGRD